MGTTTSHATGKRAKSPSGSPERDAQAGEKGVETWEQSKEQTLESNSHINSHHSCSAMIKILESFYDNLSKWPDAVLYEDSMRNQHLTISALEEMSAKVYGYLLSHNIGTEDVVAIWLPKGIHVPVVILGVIKAGAAFVVIGEQAGQSNAEFFIEDSNAKLTVTPEVMEEILKSDPVRGYKTPELTDLACIIYSSGSSGYFKGAMHEYGQYDRCMAYCEEKNRSQGSIPHQERVSLIQGFYGIAGIIHVVHTFMFGNYNDIMPYEIAKDVDRFKNELVSKRITSSSLSPSHIKMGNWLDGTYLQNATITFEMFDGIYSDRIALFNRYGMTETFGVMCHFLIDRPYDMTPCGRPLPFVKLYLADEKGQKVPDGVIGEVYADSPYFRGYANRPEETARTLVDGYVRTGDMAVVENGLYVILGRKMDLFQTEEGYIIPSKISIEAKNAMGLSWCYVKCFEHEPSPVICVYYTDDVDIDLNALREKLAKRLPPYMLPTHVVKLDTVSRFSSGKVNRHSFKSPLSE